MATTWTHLGCDIQHRSQGAAERCKYGVHNPSSPSAKAAAVRELERRRQEAQREVERKRRQAQKEAERKQRREAAGAAKAARRRGRAEGQRSGHGLPGPSSSLDVGNPQSGSGSNRVDPTGKARTGTLSTWGIVQLVIMSVVALFFLLLVIGGFGSGETGVAMFSLVALGLLGWWGWWAVHHSLRPAKHAASTGVAKAARPVAPHVHAPTPPLTAAGPAHGQVPAAPFVPKAEAPVVPSGEVGECTPKVVGGESCSQKTSSPRAALSRPSDSSSDSPRSEASPVASSSRARPPVTPKRLSHSLERAQFTRKATGHIARDQVYTAIDLETTGLEPPSARACEVGLVKFRGDGVVLDEFSTLIRCLGSTEEARSVHGIEDAELRDAPAPEDVWREVFAFMRGTIVVAHNLDFEKKFMRDESVRLGIGLNDMVGICTLVESRRHLEGRAFSLKSLHRTVSGAWRDDTHQALGDARATRDVALWLIDSCPGEMRVTRKSGVSFAKEEFPRCVIRPRGQALHEPTIKGLLESFPQSPSSRDGDPRAIATYMELLVEVLDDGRLTYGEIQSLAQSARLTGLTGTQLVEVHRQAWKETFPDADGLPIRRERKTLPGR